MKDHLYRRYLSWAEDFDTRSYILTTEIKDDWDLVVKETWATNKEKVASQLRHEFGLLDWDKKVQNFIDIGIKPFSIISYHNKFFAEARSAFVIGAYYPSLTASCSLGERILNHLILDLRGSFKSHPLYKKVHSKEAFDNWRAAIRVLDEWGVLLPDVSKSFHGLHKLRVRSIHYNEATYKSVRKDALAALLHLNKIIGQQFGVHGNQPWLIEGTAGQSFIKKSHESLPFIQKYFLPRCPFVGPLFAVQFGRSHRASFHDILDYGNVELTDEQFRDAYNRRAPMDVVKPSSENVIFPRAKI